MIYHISTRVLCFRVRLSAPLASPTLFPKAEFPSYSASAGTYRDRAATASINHNHNQSSLAVCIPTSSHSHFSLARASRRRWMDPRRKLSCLLVIGELEGLSVLGEEPGSLARRKGTRESCGVRADLPLYSGTPNNERKHANGTSRRIRQFRSCGCHGLRLTSRSALCQCFFSPSHSRCTVSAHSPRRCAAQLRRSMSKLAEATH